MTQDREQLIRERAFQIWIEQGQPHGKHQEHWQQAEAALVSGTSPPLQPKHLGDNEEGQTPAEVPAAGGNNPDDLTR